MYRKPICGIYKITNLINNKCYVGSSKCVQARFCEHFTREPKKYPRKLFYKEVVFYGKENFKCEVLEECKENELIEREQYYYDLLQPEYNVVRPTHCNFLNEEVRRLARESCAKPSSRLKARAAHNTEEYKKKAREINRYKFRPVLMYNDVFELKFECMRDCAKWLDANTSYIGKNKTSKVKDVCDGIRPSAYGFKFKYIESVETIPNGSKVAIDTQLEAVGTKG